ncbi:MAG: hypothetical protein ACREJN_13880, partial [Nitrospiraceae bacterium]
MHRIDESDAGPPRASLAGDVFAISDPHNKNNQFLILNSIDDPTVTLADAIQVILSGEFLHALWARGVSQGLEAPDETFLNRGGEGFELAFSRRGKDDRIGYGRLQAEFLQDRIEWSCTLLLGFGQC